MNIVVDLDYTTLRPSADYHNWRWYDEDPVTWIEFPPIEGAIAVLEHLHEQGHVITFVTARPQHLVNIAWLKENCANIDWRLVEACSNKWFVPADVYIDDSPTVCQGLWERGLCVIKFDNGYNSHAPCSYFVHGWYAIAKLFDEGIDTKIQRHKRSDRWHAERATLGDRKVLAHD